jgi:hypothetical protein
MDQDPDPGGPKTYGSDGSATLIHSITFVLTELQLASYLRLLLRRELILGAASFHLLADVPVAARVQLPIYHARLLHQILPVEGVA